MDSMSVLMHRQEGRCVVVQTHPNNPKRKHKISRAEMTEYILKGVRYGSLGVRKPLQKRAHFSYMIYESPPFPSSDLNNIA